MPTKTYQRDRGRLAERLRELRERSGLSGTALARQLGWVQSKVSKIETAKQLPSEHDVRVWTDGVDAGPGVVDELLALLQRAQVEYATWRDTYRVAGGADAKQADILALESQSTCIATFQPAMVPGLLQTTEYAREILTLPCGPARSGADEAAIGRMVAARMQRQQVLYQPGKSVRIVMLEAALRTRLCSPATLAGQLDRLIAVAGLPSLTLSIVAADTTVPIYPLSGFDMYDDDLVVFETIAGELQLNEAADVADCARYFQQLEDAGEQGLDAVNLIQHVLTELRS